MATTFQSWINSIPSTPSSQLRSLSHTHFLRLSTPSESSSNDTTAAANTNPTQPTSINEDISSASAQTSNGALALLVSSLRPVINDVTSRESGLHLLLGALEGCHSLTSGVRRAVGRFLVELCRTYSSHHYDLQEEDSSRMILQNNQQDMLFVDGEGLSSEEITARLQEMDRRTTNHGNRSNNIRSTTSAATAAAATGDNEASRDTALSCLTALLSSYLDVFPTMQSSKNAAAATTTMVGGGGGGGVDSSLKEALSVLYESMELRMDLAMKGVQYRVMDDLKEETNENERAMSNGDDEEYEQEYNHDEENEMNMDNLSRLPRAKRSLCFALLEGALDGLSRDIARGDTLLSPSSKMVFSTSLKKTMVRFTCLMASCLHGETDPRCLLQLLRLLNKAQRILSPLFINDTTDPTNMDTTTDNNSSNHLHYFPSTKIFDAVAPYYPVHFTPPKNDPYRITREMLNDALMNVLCEHGVTIHTSMSTTMEDGDETIIVHAARIFMERLDAKSSMDYQPPVGVGSEEENMAEAVGDLSRLLLLPSHPKIANDTSDMVGEGNHRFHPNITRVTPGVFSELSSTLTRVHEDAVNNTSATDTSWKTLASSIRQFASSVAYSLELLAVSDKHPNTSAMWEAFVVNTMQRLSPSLESTRGVKGRASTAYLASMAACGGIETLNKVLEACLPRFLGMLDHKNNMNNDEKIASIRGIAALMSSSRVGVERWEKENDGVRLHPHPLASYFSDIVRRMSVVFDAGVECRDESLLSAVVAALESMLTSADLSQLNDASAAIVIKMISWLAEIILMEGSSQDTTDGMDIDFTYEWKKSCARTIGVFIATSSLHQDEIGGGELNVLAQKLFQQIIDSAITHSSSTTSTRLDCIILAMACSNGSEQVAHQIVETILSETMPSLSLSNSNCPALKAFSFITRNGGSNVAKVFHSLTPPNTTPLDIINELCKSPTNDADARGQLSTGISQLKLPATITQEEETCKSVVDARIEGAYSILPYLMPAFECASAALSFRNVVDLLNQALPPLSRWDEVILCVVSPLLVAILSNSDDVKGLLGDISPNDLESMIRQLSEFAISSRFEKQARASAASSLFLLFLHAEFDFGSLPMPQIVCDALYGPLFESLKTLQSDAKNPLAFARVEEIFSFMGYWGSIAASKGGLYSNSADEIAAFLVGMACNGSSPFPFSNYAIELGQKYEGNSKHTVTGNYADISILPALSFGNMLTVHSGSPFWRQRIIFKSIPAVMTAVQQYSKSQNPPSCGCLAVCSILCCVPSSLLSHEDSKNMVPVLIAGLVHLSKEVHDVAHAERSPYTLDVLGLNLAAIIKVLSQTSEVLVRFIGVVVSSLLRLCAYTKYNDEFLPKQMLALQCLENVATASFPRHAKLREQEQVVNALSAVVDHPSVIIRQAVVHVRNIWYTL